MIFNKKHSFKKDIDTLVRNDFKIPFTSGQTYLDDPYFELDNTKNIEYLSGCCTIKSSSNGNRENSLIKEIDLFPLSVKKNIWSFSYQSFKRNLLNPIESDYNSNLIHLGPERQNFTPELEIQDSKMFNSIESGTGNQSYLSSDKNVCLINKYSNLDDFNNNEKKYILTKNKSNNLKNIKNQTKKVAEFNSINLSKKVHLNLTFTSYKGETFNVPKNSKFFVIKSYNILDIKASFNHGIWASTDLGNKRLNKAFKQVKITGIPEFDGKIFLFFLVNSSGKFCGIAEMKNNIDFTKVSNIWVERSRWKGIFSVEWLLIKDVPNRYFQHLIVPTNEFKPVINSRDTQEIPPDVGISMLKIISSFKQK